MSSINYATIQRPLSQRINFRIILFIAVVSLPFVGLVYGFVSFRNGIQYGKDLVKVDLKALGNFPLPLEGNDVTDQNIPPRWRDLDGKRVQLEGFMWAGQEAGGKLSQFQFVYNVAKCCFNGPPQVQERVFAIVPPGRTVDFTGDFVRLTGVLHVKVKKQEGVVVSIFTLDVEKSEPIS